MIKLYADFNDRTSDGGYWILQYEGTDIEAKAADLGLSLGDRVLLYQDEDDFEVTATLEFRFVDAIGRETWVAFPDWSTIDRKPPLNAPAAAPSPPVRKRRVA
jgi:hypothetical protein